jgi:hypothetical protein
VGSQEQYLGSFRIRGPGRLHRYGSGRVSDGSQESEPRKNQAFLVVPVVEVWRRLCTAKPTNGRLSAS